MFKNCVEIDIENCPGCLTSQIECSTPSCDLTGFCKVMNILKQLQSSRFLMDPKGSEGILGTLKGSKNLLLEHRGSQWILGDPSGSYGAYGAYGAYDFDISWCILMKFNGSCWIQTNSDGSWIHKDTKNTQTS